MTEVPTSTVDVILKQVNLDDLNERALAAMQVAFEPFMKWNPGEAVMEESIARASAMLGGNNLMPGSTTQRRFAGDSSLGRGRYYSIAKNRAGNDGGTLQHELAAYFSPKEPGWIGIIDLTLPENCSAGSRLGAISSQGPSLVISFHPLDGRPHTFAARFSKLAAPFLVGIPLRITSRRITKVVDLRLPSTTAWFTKRITRLRFSREDKLTKCFPLKRPLNEFKHLIPTLLEQHLGSGEAFCSMAGIYLRTLGVNGLIYPSARVDSSVRVDRHRVVECSGWNFVDYHRSKLPTTSAIVDLSTNWPSKVGQFPSTFDAEVPPRPYHGVRLHYRRQGRMRGTWSVAGLTSWQDAIFRCKSAESVVKAKRPTDCNQLMQTIWSRWFLLIPTADELLGRADVFFRALLGERDSLETITKWVVDLRIGGHEDLASALEIATLPRSS